MKMYFPFLLLIFSLLISSASENEHLFTTITIYESFEDYESDKGTVYHGEFKSGVHGIGPGVNNKYINFRNTAKDAKSKKFKIKMKKIWGFKLDEYLFRVNKSSACPMYLRSHGKFCYFENGAAIIRKIGATGGVDGEIRNSLSNGEWGLASYASKDINSKLYAIGSKSSFKRYVKKNPELQELIDCIYPAKWKEALQKKRDCIEDYNSK